MVAECHEFKAGQTEAAQQSPVSNEENQYQTKPAAQEASLCIQRSCCICLLNPHLRQASINVPASIRTTVAYQTLAQEQSRVFFSQIVFFLLTTAPDLCCIPKIRLKPAQPPHM